MQFSRQWQIDEHKEREEQKLKESRKGIDCFILEKQKVHRQKDWFQSSLKADETFDKQEFDDKIIKVKEFIDKKKVDLAKLEDLKILEHPTKKQKDEIYELEISIWIATGFIEHQIDLSALQKVSLQYKRIGILPTDYNQAALWNIK